MNSVMKKLRNALGDQRGFTLIEMMIVIAIIGLIMGLVGLQVTKKLDEGRVSSTKIQIQQLGNVLDDFKRVCGRYPTTDQGLEALARKPDNLDCKGYDPEGFMKKLPKDAWSKDFGYTSDGAKYEIKSYGSDGQEGGEGINKDILSSEI